MLFFYCAFVSDNVIYNKLNQFLYLGNIQKDTYLSELVAMC